MLECSESLAMTMIMRMAMAMSLKRYIHKIQMKEGRFKSSKFLGETLNN